MPLCPRQCGVNRLKGERCFCRAPARPVIFSSHTQFGEEISLVGRNGSGTIFFSNCNLRCVSVRTGLSPTREKEKSFRMMICNIKNWSIQDPNKPQISRNYRFRTDKKASLLNPSPPGFAPRFQAWISCQKTKYHLNADIIELCLDSAQLSEIAL